MKKNKYIKEFNITGQSIINVDRVCKDWDDLFSISTWESDNGIKYTLLIRGKRKGSIHTKTEISEGQAIEIASRLNLVHVKSTLFKSGGTYYSKEFVDSEIVKYKELENEKELELQVIKNLRLCYQFAK